MSDVAWVRYPRTATCATARAWLLQQVQLQLAPKTVEAYGRSLEDFLAFCEGSTLDPPVAGRADIARYVQSLTTRPVPRRANGRYPPSAVGLANATIQLRLTVVRLYFDYLLEEGLRADNPVGRGRYTPRNSFGGQRERGLLRRSTRLPWIPNDDQWLAVLAALRPERLRNRAMVLLAYDGALRREELVALTLDDLDFPYRQATIRPETAKRGAGRPVFYGQVTERVLTAYLQERRVAGRHGEALFLSQSRRNPGHPLSPVGWSKILGAIARRAGLPHLTPHTLRHLRLTHMARAHLDIHEIATYAGHRSLETTRLYIHLGGGALAERVRASMAAFDRQLARVLEGGHG
jgi:integrase/recombinase XerD